MGQVLEDAITVCKQLFRDAGDQPRTTESSTGDTVYPYAYNTLIAASDFVQRQTDSTKLALLAELYERNDQLTYESSTAGTGPFREVIDDLLANNLAQIMDQDKAISVEEMRRETIAQAAPKPDGLP